MTLARSPDPQVTTWQAVKPQPYSFLFWQLQKQTQRLKKGHSTGWSAWDNADHGVTVKVSHHCKLLQDQRSAVPGCPSGPRNPLLLYTRVYGTQKALGLRQALLRAQPHQRRYYQDSFSNRTYPQQIHIHLLPSPQQSLQTATWHHLYQHLHQAHTKDP